MKVWMYAGLATLAISAQGATRFVAATGIDGTNDCLNAGSPCFTVAHAVDEADPGDVILLSEGLYTEADIEVDKSLTIQGTNTAATILQASPALGLVTNRVFDFAAGQTSLLQQVTIQNGFAGFVGGDGGGLRNRGTLTVEDCVIHNNAADDNGGGVESDGTTTLIRTTVRDNTAGDDGGGLSTRDHMTLIECVISNNGAGHRTATALPGVG